MKRFFLFFSIIGVVWLGYTSISIYEGLEKSPNEIGRWIVTDRYGNIITDLPGKWGYRTPYQGDFDKELIKNIIEIEDRRFYQHSGIDIVGKIVTLRDRMQHGIIRGGSTITEQYVKNRYFPEKNRTLIQKSREALWAIIVELKYTKEEILRNYLDSVYMGNNLYGIATVEGEYFDHVGLENLSDDAQVEIITRLRYPNLGGNAENYRERIGTRLGLAISDTPLPVRDKKSYTDIFPFFTSRIKKELSLYCSGQESKLYRFLANDIPHDICRKNGDIMIRSSLDMVATLKASETLEATLYPLEEKNVANGAILVTDGASSKILIYVGNRSDATGNAIDMIRVRRSVGSVLKPFLYLMALHSGHAPDDLILDETKIYNTPKEDVSYITENYTPRPYGPVTLREALGNSLNSSAVRLTESLGLGRIYASLRSLGFPLEHDVGYYGYAMMLGAIQLSLEEVVDGYQHLKDGDDKENFLISDILRDETNRSMTFSISSILNTSIPLAVKTGTSTDFRDNWTVGYSKDIIIGVWVGNVDGSSMDDVSGVTGAGPIYHSVAEDLISRGYIQRDTLYLPTGVEKRDICLDEKCFQKIQKNVPTGYIRRSRPKSGIYYESDFVTPLTKEEKEKWKIR